MSYLDMRQDAYSNGLDPNGTSSNAVASRLFARSRKNSFSSEPELIQMSPGQSDMLHLSNISTEMSALAKRLAECQEEKSLLSDERTRLRAENSMLLERIHSIEDQIASTESRCAERLRSELDRAKESIQRVEREKELELENQQYKLQVMEKDLEAARKDVRRLEHENDDLHSQVSKQSADLEEVRQLAADLDKEKRTLRTEFDNYRKEAEYELQEHQDELDQLSKQTDELREFRSQNRPRLGSMMETMDDLENRCDALQQDNKLLREQNDELKAQILSQSVQSGQMLLANGPSLAAELNGMDSDELMKALHEQELCNQRLRNYIDGILLRVVELYPQILEVACQQQDRHQAESAPACQTSVSPAATEAH